MKQQRLHLVIDGDVTTNGAAFAQELRRLASQVEAYTHEELAGATFEMNGSGVIASVELRETGDDE